jgi:hypothetical protein
MGQDFIGFDAHIPMPDDPIEHDGSSEHSSDFAPEVHGFLSAEDIANGWKTPGGKGKA